MNNVRLGFVKVGVAGTGLLTVLVALVVFYALSLLFWGWLLMLGMGNWGPYHWSYFYTITHWALLCPFVLGWKVDKTIRRMHGLALAGYLVVAGLIMAAVAVANPPGHTIFVALIGTTIVVGVGVITVLLYAWPEWWLKIVTFRQKEKNEN